MLIKAIRHSEHGALVYVEFADPRAVLTVYSTDLDGACALAVGEEISDEVFSYLSDRYEYYKATKRALSILSHSDNTALALKRKLVMKGFSVGTADEAVKYMASLGYINESAQLERLILREANESLFGPKKIFLRLIAKGYSASDIKSVTRRLCDSEEIDFGKNLELLFEKKCAVSAEDKKKIKFKYGY